jgi:glycosyltransferase involved in cell wall biosynthesis
MYFIHDNQPDCFFYCRVALFFVRLGDMKALLTTNNVGEIWIYAMELARKLGEESISVVLATMGWPLTPAQHREAEALANLDVFESLYKPEWMENPWDDVERAGQWLLRMRDEVQPDIIHLNSYSFGSLDWGLPVLITGHSEAVCRWLAIHQELPAGKFDLYREKVKAGIAGADELVAPTQAMLDVLDEFYGPLDKGLVIPNGRDPAIFHPQRKEPFILACGRLWDEAKNIGILDEVASNISWPIRIDGENPSSGNVSSHKSSLQLTGSLSTDDRIHNLERASIYILPAKYEPFGISALEAGLAGCALVLADLPSLREVWQDAAIYVPPDESPAISQALNRLIRNESMLHQYADRAYLRALEYSPDRMAAAYLRLYRSLMQYAHEIEAETAV